MFTLDDILNATKSSDLFPPNLNEKEAKTRYQRFLRAAHPDVNPNRGAEASIAFQRVTTFWNERISNVSVFESMGDGGVIRTKKGQYVYETPRYLVEGVGFAAVKNNPNSYLMFSTKPENTNSFVETLQTLNKVYNIQQSTGYYPEIKDSFLFTYKGTKVAGALLETKYVFRELYTLRDIYVDYSEGLEDQKVAWLYLNILRLLRGFEYAGYIHGAAFVDAFFVNPAEGNFVVKDWHYSVRNGNFPRLINREALKYYPQEINNFSGLSSATDLTLSAQACLMLISSKSDGSLESVLRNTINFPGGNISHCLERFETYVEDKFGSLEDVRFNMKRL